MASISAQQHKQQQGMYSGLMVSIETHHPSGSSQTRNQNGPWSIIAYG